MSIVYALILISIASGTSACNHVSVNNSTGNNSLCVQCHANVPCKTLENSSILFSGQENVSISVETDITLTGFIDVRDAKNITISSKNATKMTIHCNGMAGFRFYNVT